jgi:lipoprotein-releasing system permease protein
VAAFNIIATLVMMVFDKRREIAILKSMGATHGEIARIFLHVGTVVGLYGIAIGLAVGFGICLLLVKVGWPLDPKVYLIDHLPVQIDALDFLLTAGVAFVICQLATIVPSIRASNLRPIDGIRHK